MRPFGYRLEPHCGSKLRLKMLHNTLVLVSCICSALLASACDQELLDKTFVSQCNPTLCEPALEGLGAKFDVDEWPTSSQEVVHIVSSRAGLRFSINRYKAFDTTEFYYEDSHVNGTIFVDTQVKYQKILGFGTTLTDSSCKNVDDLPADIRQRLINDYFNPHDGIGLNLIRVPIGSTKYSYSNYVLDQPDENQVELSPYDLDHRLPIIKDAMTAAGKLKSRVKVIASSDSAPAEYKQNRQIVYGGSLEDSKIENYANYLVNFINAYKSHGIDIWSLILSESPMTNQISSKSNSDTMDFNSMSMRPSQAKALISSIEKAASKHTNLGKFRLLILGDDRSYIPVWADSMFGSTDTSASVAGVGYNCNGQQPTSYDNLVYVSNRYPTKYLLATRGSVNAPMKLGNWQYAENYVTEMVKNLQYGSVGWIDHNLALDLQGGPAISEKFKADAAVIVDPKRSSYYRNPMFYAIGHLSRYVKPGSTRVKIDFHSSPHMYASQYAAFLTPQNYLVVFVANNNIGPMPVNIGINTRTKTEALLDTKSFNTFLFRL